MSEFHFLRPVWLLLNIPLILGLIYYVRRRFWSGAWQSVCDPRLLPYLLDGKVNKPKSFELLIVGITAALAIVALAGPVWRQLPQPVFQAQSALVIALDLSKSMDAQDLKPSRLVRAQHKIRDLLKQRRDGQTALLVYAGDAFTVTPLTTDVETIDNLVTDLTTDMMPASGSDVTSALRLAAELFTGAGVVSGELLVITDAIDVEQAAADSTEFSKAGHRISVLGVGTSQGAPITLAAGGFVKDREGNIVIPRLDEQALRMFAVQNNGRYHSITVDDRDLNALLSTKLDLAFSQAKLSDQQTDLWREEGPWLLLPVLLITSLVFRRGMLVVLVFLTLPITQDAYAFDWTSLWKNTDQVAAELLEGGDPQSAAKLFTRPDWQAAAHFKAGEFEQALQKSETLVGPEADYNRGNALAKLGRLQQAIQAYDKTLEADPKHEDALHNRELLTELLKQQQNQNQQQSQDQQQEGSDKQQESQPSDSQETAQDEQNQNAGQAEQDQAEQEQENPQQNDQSQASKSEPNSAANDQSEAQPEEQRPNQAEDDSKAQAMASDEQEQQAAEDDFSVESADSESQQLEAEELEQQLATQQWLRKIPDDPGGLLKRKFQYQYGKRQSRTNSEQNW